MQIKQYQVIQNLDWACPGMVLWVNSDNLIVARQLNPENGLTYESVDEDINFEANDYAFVVETTKALSTQEIKALHKTKAS